MNTGQYRALVAYLSYWPGFRTGFRFEDAMEDIGITLTKDEALHHLFKAGWEWDDDDKELIYDV